MSRGSLRLKSGGADTDEGGGYSMMGERVLLVVLKALNWNPVILCSAACVCKRISDLSRRLLWKELCLFHAPKIGSHSLASGVDTKWNSLGKLLFYCPGYSYCHMLKCTRPSPGHYVSKTRFSKTAGKKFLAAQCRTDTLFISDPCCEHLGEGPLQPDVAVFRGVICAFASSKTWRMLRLKGLPMEPNVFCPFCNGTVWSLSKAQMLPRTARIKLGALDDNIDSYVCLNGHFYGMCALEPVSISDTISTSTALSISDSTGLSGDD